LSNFSTNQRRDFAFTRDKKKGETVGEKKISHVCPIWAWSIFWCTNKKEIWAFSILTEEKNQELFRDQGSISPMFYSLLLCSQIPKVLKIESSYQSFVLLRSACIKAAPKTLVKSTPGVFFSFYDDFVVQYRA